MANELEELIRVGFNNFIKDIHTALPAKVLRFDKVKQTVDLEIQQKRRFLDKREDALPPPLIDVPVHFYRCGGLAITMPINVGDTGLVVFAERSLDEWQVLGSVEVPSEARTHSLSDGTFYPTMHNDKNVISNYSDNLEIRTEDGNSKITISKDGRIEIQKGNNKVLDILSQALGLLGNATVTIDSGSSAGTYNIDQDSQWLALKALIDDIRL